MPKANPKKGKTKTMPTKAPIKRANPKRPTTTKKFKPARTGFLSLHGRLGKLPLILFILAFAGVGSYLLLKSHAAANGNVYAQGNKLYLNGAEFKFTGINAYQLSSDYILNNGCGDNTTAADVDAFFSTLRPNSMVRFWAFQSMARDRSGNLTFPTMDNIIASAQKYNVKVIPVLANQWNNCTESRKTEAWYGGGYKTDATAGSLAYWNYLDQIIPRYAGSTAIGMWEPVNEPASDDGNNNCSSTAPATLRSFFDSVGGKIHTLDPNHLVSSGLQGSGQCGSRDSQYQTLHQSPGIDVGSYHDYMAGTIPGDQWNGLQVRLNQMAAINKPLYIGEVGIVARDNVANCTTTSQRRDLMKQKMDAQFTAGITGFVPWSWVKPNNKTDCTSTYGFEIEQGQDVLQTLLHDYPLPEGGSSTQDTTPPSTPTNLTATAQSTSQINLSWTANPVSDGVTGYDVYRDNVKITTVGTNSYNDTGLTASSPYRYYLIASDAAGNSSPASATVSVTTLASPPATTDTNAPIVTITSPTNGSTISRSLTVSASATDNVKVTKMEVYMDGNLYCTTTSSTISCGINTRKTASGAHTITVKAYDAANNIGQASVTVNK